MTLSESDLKRLIEMQRLCAQVGEDRVELARFRKNLKAILKRQNELIDFYQNEWMELVDGRDISPEQAAELQKAVEQGGFSILDQDTIWNVLDASEAVTIALLKDMVKNL